MSSLASSTLEFNRSTAAVNTNFRDRFPNAECQIIAILDGNLFRAGFSVQTKLHQGMPDVNVTIALLDVNAVTVHLGDSIGMGVFCGQLNTALYQIENPSKYGYDQMRTWFLATMKLWKKLSPEK